MSFTEPVRDAKAAVKVTESDGQESNYLDVYFLEDIVNSDIKTLSKGFSPFSYRLVTLLKRLGSKPLFSYGVIMAGKG